MNIRKNITQHHMYTYEHKKNNMGHLKSNKKIKK